MELLRIPPYPLNLTFTVPDAEGSYDVEITDMQEETVLSGEYVSDENAEISIDLYQDFVNYDATYYVDASQIGDIKFHSTLDIVRPYVDINGSTNSETEENKKNEEIARFIIDSITGGFYHKKIVLQTTGLGTDYVPVWDKVHRVHKVIENNKVVYDITLEEPEVEGYSYILTTDKTAITKNVLSEYNRRESKALSIPSGSSDILDIYGRSAPMFPSGYDYTFILEAGYPAVPADIKRAASLLIEDIKCGKLDYYKRYVKSYSTDQFKLEYSPKLLDGTGNLIVDKILKKYTPSIYKIGVL